MNNISIEEKIECLRQLKQRHPNSKTIGELLTYYEKKAKKTSKAKEVVI